MTAQPVVRPADSDLDRLAALLNDAPRVTIFGGIGCAGAHNEVMALAKTLHAPVGFSFRGKEWLEYDNPYAVGMTGLLGWGAAFKAMHECDVLLLLGTDFPYESFMPLTPQIVQIDLRPERLGRRSKLDVGLCGDVKATIDCLLPRLRPRSDRGFLDHLREEHAAAQRKLRAYADQVSTRRPIHPEYAAAAVSEFAHADAIFTIDTGMCAVWGARYLSASPARRILGSFNHGSMANALVQAIGAQMAFPGRQVISFSGDGGLGMMLGELLTIVQHQLPIKIVLFDNHRLGMVQLEMEAAGLPHYGCERTNPNFALLAQAAGLTGMRVEDPAEVRPALEKALAAKGPVLVDVVTDPNVLSMPPKATIRQAAGFAMAMTKMAFAGELDDVLDTVAGNWRIMP